MMDTGMMDPVVTAAIVAALVSVLILLRDAKTPARLSELEHHMKRLSDQVAKCECCRKGTASEVHEDETGRT